MAAKLAATVHVRDPKTHQMVALEAGSEPEPHLAALVTNPDAWEGGKLPTAAKKSADGDDSADTKTAAKKAASSPARGRKAAAEGTGGQ